RAPALQNIAQPLELVDQPIDLLVGAACHALKQSIDPARTDLAVAFRRCFTRGFNVPEDAHADLSFKLRDMRQTRFTRRPAGSAGGDGSFTRSDVRRRGGLLR